MEPVNVALNEKNYFAEVIAEGPWDTRFPCFLHMGPLHSRVSLESEAEGDLTWTHGEGEVAMETESGLIQPRARESHRQPGLGDRSGSCPRTSCGSAALPTPRLCSSDADFGPLTSRTCGRILFCCFKLPTSLWWFVTAATGNSYNDVGDQYFQGSREEVWA